jgi:hypothetical protein
MTNRLEMNWSLDGIVDEQRYYCSETPIDSENLPVPKAVLNGDVRTYVDTAIEVGKTYYVRVGSVKNGVEKISSEISVVAIKSLVYMPLTGGLQDFGSLGNTWSNTGGVTFDENGALFSNYAQHLSSSYQMNFNQDFKITFEVKRLYNTNTYPYLFTNDSGSWSAGNFAMAFAGENANSSFKNRIMIGVSSKYDLQSSATFSNNVFYSVEISRVGNVIKVKVDGIEVISRTETNTINVTNLFRLGCAINNGANGQFKGYIRNFIVHNVS